MDFRTESFDFDEIFNNLKEYKLITDEEIEKIISYMNGEISFEDIGLTPKYHMLYHTKHFIAMVNDNFNKLILDKEQFIRVMKVLFSFIHSEDDNLTSSDTFYNIGGILEEFKYLKEIFKFAQENKKFYDEVMDKEKMIRSIFVKAVWHNAEATKKLIKRCGENILAEFIESSPYIRDGNHFRYKDNLKCSMILATMPTLTKENESEVKQKVLEYLSFLSDDYFVHPGGSFYEVDFDVQDKKFSLTSDEKTALLELVKTGENWDENIDILKNSMDIFMVDDPSFEELCRYILTLEDVEFVQRFKKMLFQLSTRYIEQYIFIKKRSSYANYIKESGDKEKGIEKLNSFLSSYPYITNEIFEYTFKNILNDFLLDNEQSFFKLMLENFDIKLLLEHLSYLDGDFYQRGIYLLDKFNDEELIRQKKQELKENLLDELFSYICDSVDSAKTLKAYVYGGIKEIDITKLLKKKLKESGENTAYYLFDTDEQRRLIYILLNTKNTNLIQLLPKYFFNLQFEELYGSLQIDLSKVHLESLLDTVIELDINTKEFLKAICEYFSISPKTKFNSNEYRYYIIKQLYKQKENFNALEYLNKKGIACIELASSFPTKLKKLLLNSIYINRSKIDTKLALLFVEYLDTSNTLVIDELKKLEGNSLKEVENKIYDELSTYNKKKELLSVEVLCHYKSDEQKLKDIYIDLKEPKSRDIIANSIKIDLDELL